MPGCAQMVLPKYIATYSQVLRGVALCLYCEEVIYRANMPCNFIAVHVDFIFVSRDGLARFLRSDEPSVVQIFYTRDSGPPLGFLP